jgi:adenine-specific DNA-methyltransferase
VIPGRQGVERLAEVRPLHPALQVGDGSENLLVRGDALHALTSLLRLDGYRDRYAGKVRLCYLDPPFNTGETFQHYRDAVARSEWLATLRDRLVLIRRLLAPDGSVWVHLDDSEQHRARCVLDEVFGPKAFVATVIWQKRTSRDNRTAFSAMHDYIHVYAPLGPVAWKRLRNPLPDGGEFSNPDGDPNGPWRSVPLTAQAGHGTAGQFYTIVSPAGDAHDPPAGRCWTYTRERFDELVAAGRVYWPRAGRGKPRLKRYLHEATGLAPFTIWMAAEVGENADAKKALLAAFPGRPPFDTPKPEALLQRIIHIATNPGELVLDCFLGSGTTAVVAQRMGRRWVGVERSAEVVDGFALPRLRAALDGQGRGFTVVDLAPDAPQGLATSSTSAS